MRVAKRMAAFAAAATMLAGSPAAAQDEITTAVQLRKLDMMLMVTALRCRFGADNFSADYEAFKVQHQETLRLAATVVLDDLARQLGRKGAIAAFDRMSTGFANTYGMGNPRFGCADLKLATTELSLASGQASLVAAADTLLAAGPAGEALIASR